MKKLCPTSLKFLLTGACLLPCVLGKYANAQQYFDVNGATTGSGVVANSTYTWENADWSTSTAGTAATVNWVDGTFVRFAAGTDAAAKNYSVMANSTHTIAGMFLQSNGGGTVTVNGPGVLNITATGGPIQGFLVNSASQSLIINASLGGAGGVENELSGSLFLYGNNTYSGGTVLGTGAGLNFNNNNSFGTAAISWGVASQTLVDPAGTSPVTIGNTMVTRSASTLTFVTTAAAPVTFSGAWNMASGTATLTLGNTPNPSTKMIISGAMTGSGANLSVGGQSASRLILSGANTYNGTTTVTGARLQGGAANEFANTSKLILSGGTFDPGGFNQAMASVSLMMTTSSTIDYGAGSAEIDFANSSGQTWTGVLDLLNWTGGTDALRFGTDASGLTSGQLADIEFNNDPTTIGHAFITSAGYVMIPEPSTIALALLGGLSMLVTVRRFKA